jgi:hypothetical protein
MNHSKVHSIWFETENLDYNEKGNKLKKKEWFKWTKENLKKGKKALKKYINETKTEVNYGDFVEHKGVIPYRNEGLAIWNGSKLVGMDFNTFDEYGMLPSEFKVLYEHENLGFIPLDYYHGGNETKRCVEHNRYVWIDLSQDLNEIKRNTKKARYIQVTEGDSDDEKDDIFRYTFMVEGKRKQIKTNEPLSVKLYQECNRTSYIKRNGKKYKLFLRPNSEIDDCSLVWFSGNVLFVY